MQETQIFSSISISISISNTRATISSNPSRPHLPLPPNHDFPSLSHPKNPRFPSLSTKTNTTLPPPSKPTSSSSDFEQKMLYLDSIGIDFLSLIEDHPPILTFPLSDMKSTVDFVVSTVGFTAIEFRRVVGMCPDVLSSRVSDVVPVFTFLTREARVNGSDLKRVINRRPRLLGCSVKNRLRPTLYFLQSIGIAEVNKHTDLLSCSVEEKFLPRIEYLEKIGFSHRDAVSMFRRFPQLFCYSIKENFEPKFDYFVVEMGRELRELKEFPQYFSFSLDKRIKPRHQSCVEKGVCFPLPILLKTSNARFRDRLEVCCNTSLPFKSSPLWCTDCDIHSI
ncbi:transcription termination factor MTEF1, chloroplastic [Cannabis sativa]|uniref:transcription termination factor MTEF1, chloroplastic n=1 Tax=Cannabis sativa TaxID=3483 RepID=UPI0011DF3172|nr:transcription termination factor MTEF1, chloroplastic [Cannabis sativa]